MSKSKKPTPSVSTDLCMFCGKDGNYGEMNREHFVAKCFWNGVRPRFTKVVPAHVKCNSEHADDSEYLRDVLCVEEGAHRHPEVHRLLGGSIKRKWQKRPGKLMKMLHTAQVRPVLSPFGLYLGHAPSFVPDWPRMQSALRNIVRGVFYAATGKPMPPEFQINVGDVSYDIPAPLQECIAHLPDQWNGFGDDVFACRYRIDSRYRGAIACQMRFYGRRSFFAFSYPPNFGVRKDGTVGYLPNLG